MPVYEFECSCGHQSEELVKVGTSTMICPICGNPMRKLISMSSFHLKGSGWAFDNYGSKNIKNKKHKE